MKHTLIFFLLLISLFGCKLEEYNDNETTPTPSEFQAPKKGLPKCRSGMTLEELNKNNCD